MKLYKSVLLATVLLGSIQATAHEYDSIANDFRSLPMRIQDEVRQNETIQALELITPNNEFRNANNQNWKCGVHFQTLKKNFRTGSAMAYSYIKGRQNFKVLTENLAGTERHVWNFVLTMDGTNVASYSLDRFKLVQKNTGSIVKPVLKRSFTHYRSQSCVRTVWQDGEEI